jgi:hypothetical protein
MARRCDRYGGTSWRKLPSETVKFLEIYLKWAVYKFINKQRPANILYT